VQDLAADHTVDGVATGIPEDQIPEDQLAEAARRRVSGTARGAVPADLGINLIVDDGAGEGKDNFRPLLEDGGALFEVVRRHLVVARRESYVAAARELDNDCLVANAADVTFVAMVSDTGVGLGKLPTDFLGLVGGALSLMISSK
jgi:hypothetical protein